MKSGRLLTVQQAEQITGRKVSTWRKDILKRKITYVKIGRQVRIPIEVIEDLIKVGYRPAVNVEDENSEALGNS